MKIMILFALTFVMLTTFAISDKEAKAIKKAKEKAALCESTCTKDKKCKQHVKHPNQRVNCILACKRQCASK